MNCILFQVVHVELEMKATSFFFQPQFSDLEDIVDRLIITIVESAQKLPRVEHVLFPNLESYEMLIPAMELHDEVVQASKARALQHVIANFVGPQL